MAKFNVSTVGKTKTTNLAGSKAYKETSKLELISTLLTSFLDSKFYESGTDTQKRIVNIVGGLKDKKFAAKAAIYARTEFGMRSVSHLVAGEIANLVKGESWTKNFFDKVVYRPDDATEILAYYMSNYGKPIPNSLKKGLGLSLGKFDAYSLSKYKGEGKAISLVDLVNLVHPVPTEKNGTAIAELVKGTLKPAETWEVKLTQAGQTADSEEEKVELKADAWKDLIANKKLKYFAAIRNLRNIIEQCPEMIDAVCDIITNEKEIKKSLVMPFRYTTAYGVIEQMEASKTTRKVLSALNQAVDLACKNVPVLEGETLVAVDVSGSMSGSCAQIALLFAAILFKSNNCDVLTFDNSARYINLIPEDSIITLKNKIPFNGGGTNFEAIFAKANKKYDNIIILSDMQGWMEASLQRGLSAYKSKYTAAPRIYSFNLNDYGTLMFPEANVYCLAGWSEKVFDLMKLLEKDKNAMINEIEKVEL